MSHVLLCAPAFLRQLKKQHTGSQVLTEVPCELLAAFRWMQEQLRADQQPANDSSATSYTLLAQAADISDKDSAGGSSRHQELCLQASAVLLQDRAEAAREAGYVVARTCLLRPELHAYKADVLVGVPLELSEV